VVTFPVARKSIGRTFACVWGFVLFFCYEIPFHLCKKKEKKEEVLLNLAKLFFFLTNEFTCEV